MSIVTFLNSQDIIEAVLEFERTAMHVLVSILNASIFCINWRSVPVVDERFRKYGNPARVLKVWGVLCLKGGANLRMMNDLI